MYICTVSDKESGDYLRVKRKLQLLIKVFIDVNMPLIEMSIFLRCLILDNDAMTLGGWLIRITLLKMSSHEEVKPLLKEDLRST